MVLTVAQAELALRVGDSARAQSLAEYAGEMLVDTPLAARAHVIAARAAHLRGDDDGSRRNSIRAQALAEATEVHTAALWLEFLQSIESNDQGRGTKLLQQLEQIADHSHTHALRIRNGRAFFAFEVKGNVRHAAREIETSFGLLPFVDDPLLRTNFLNFASMVAVYLAEYERAIELAEGLITEARESGLDFVVDHALTTKVGALIGLRKLGPARRLIREIESRQPEVASFVYGQLAMKRAHIRCAAGDLRAAELLLSQAPPTVVPVASAGEWLGTRALILAAAGSARRAKDAIKKARAACDYIDPRNLCDLAEAILEFRASGKRDMIVGTVSRLFSEGHLDVVVHSARAFPPLVSAVASCDDLAVDLAFLLAASRDTDLARSAGVRIPREFRRSEGLSPREEQVYELIIEGRTNREISKTLFISESTTKVHIRHIFEKLGVHSRAEAAAASERVR